MYTVSRTFESAELAMQAIDLLDGIGGTTTKKKTKKPVAEEAEDDVDLDLDETTEDDDAITEDMIREKCKSLVKKGGEPMKAKIAAIIKTNLKVTGGISEVPEEKYEKFMELLNKIK